MGPSSSSNTLKTDILLRRKQLADGIAVCVCVYKESEEELRLNHKTFQGDPYINTSIFIVADGAPTVEEEQASNTLQALKKIWMVDETTLQEEHGCRVYTGLVGEVPYRLYVKCPEWMCGKRQSHMLFFQVLKQRYERSLMPKPFAVQMIDGNTGSYEGYADIAKLAAQLLAQPDAAAVTSAILPANHSYCGVLLNEQAYEYSYFFRWYTGGLSLFGSVQTAVGMSVLFDYNLLLTTVVPDGQGQTVMEKYCGQASTFFDLAMLDLCEDYGITLFLLQGGCDCLMCHLSHFRTTVPATWEAFIGQRRRWSTASLIGTFHLVFINSPFFLVWKNSRWLIWFYDLMSLITMVLALALNASLLSISLDLLMQDTEVIADTERSQYLAFYTVWVVLLLYFVTVFEQSRTQVRDPRAIELYNI